MSLLLTHSDRLSLVICRGHMQRFNHAKRSSGSIGLCAIAPSHSQAKNRTTKSGSYNQKGILDREFFDPRRFVIAAVGRSIPKMGNFRKAVTLSTTRFFDRSVNVRKKILIGPPLDAPLLNAMRAFDRRPDDNIRTPTFPRLLFKNPSTSNS